jgi:hypothetical protein
LEGLREVVKWEVLGVAGAVVAVEREEGVEDEEVEDEGDEDGEEDCLVDWSVGVVRRVRRRDLGEVHEA